MGKTNFTPFQTTPRFVWAPDSCPPPTGCCYFKFLHLFFVSYHPISSPFLHCTLPPLLLRPPCLSLPSGVRQITVCKNRERLDETQNWTPIHAVSTCRAIAFPLSLKEVCFSSVHRGFLSEQSESGVSTCFLNTSPLEGGYLSRLVGDWLCSARWLGKRSDIGGQILFFVRKRPQNGCRDCTPAPVSIKRILQRTTSNFHIENDWNRNNGLIAIIN